MKRRWVRERRLRKVGRAYDMALLHHAQNVPIVLNEMRRVLRDGGPAIIYEDIPQTFWDRGVCWGVIKSGSEVLR